MDQTQPHKNHTPSDERYKDNADFFRPCGRWGLKLPAISLGLWHNFGSPGSDACHHNVEADMHENCRRMIFTAFDLGITHFDLANNYGPPPGSAEERFGKILREDLMAHRDELVISTKAGYRMWPGPYGEWGSRKYLLASLDQSLKRMGVEYVDIFYSHRPDPDVSKGGAPLEETLGALDHAVQSGKALYAGISSYRGDRTRQAVEMCQSMGLAVPVIHQPSYSMLNRWIEDDLLPVTREVGMGVIAFCPLAQGLLTNKYLDGIPDDSRASSSGGFLRPSSIKPETVAKVKKLNVIAQQRGQTLAQMALCWVLRDKAVTSALIGASRPGQVRENVAALQKPSFTPEELSAIDAALAG
ncbi:MAG: L-glyceraldehyde 3-phosphate reductase [Phycisphaera sp.]|nr:L-glyceraldehyde 3-phosphate reductase [Phycisphaera sp.]